MRFSNIGGLEMKHHVQDHHVFELFDAIDITVEDEGLMTDSAPASKRPNRQDAGGKPIETLPRPLSAADTRTVWLLPRDGDLLPKEWVLAPGAVVPPTDQFSHWRDSAGPS